MKKQLSHKDLPIFDFAFLNNTIGTPKDKRKYVGWKKTALGLFLLALILAAAVLIGMFFEKEGISGGFILGMSSVIAASLALEVVQNIIAKLTGVWLFTYDGALGEEIFGWDYNKISKYHLKDWSVYFWSSFFACLALFWVLILSGVIE